MTHSDNLRGALLMTGGMAAFTLSDACMKALGGALPLAQSLTLRGVAVTAILGALALRAGGWARAGRRDWLLMGLRAAAEAGAAWCFFLALAAMPLANLSAVIQASPLVIALAAWPVLGQRVAPRRLGLILAGLAGVLLIVRPGAAGWGWPMVLAVLAVACVSLRDLASRLIAGPVPTALVTATTAAVVAATAGVASAWSAWAPVDGRSGLLLLGTTVFVMGGYAGITAAMRRGEVAFVAPFRYAGLLVALVVGVLAWGMVPDALTLLGAAIVVGTGLAMLLGERRRAAASVSAPAPAPAARAVDTPT